MSNEVALKIREDGPNVVVDVKNGTRASVTLVTHPRYLSVELLDARGQFVRGEGGADGVPGKKDFVDLAPGATAAGFATFAITRDGDTLRVGDFTFADAPPTTELRVTYRPDALVPNLPSRSRGSFFRGPATSNRLALGA